MTDHSALRSATVEELRRAQAWADSHGVHAPARLAAAALSLIAEGRENGAWKRLLATMQKQSIDDYFEHATNLRTLAGGDR